MVLSSDAMQPDGCIPGTNLTMNRLAVGGSIHSSRNEPKCVNQELVCGWDVLIGEHGDDSFDGWHELLHVTPRLEALDRLDSEHLRQVLGQGFRA